MVFHFQDADSQSENDEDTIVDEPFIPVKNGLQRIGQYVAKTFYKLDDKARMIPITNVQNALFQAQTGSMA